MIRYSLCCDRGHSFEAWFGGSDAFDRQKADGQVLCPSCGSADVSKALMTPSVSTSRKKAAQTPESEVPAPDIDAPAEQSVPVATQPALPPEALALMRELRAKVTAEAEYVGPKFAEEARKIHYGEREEGGIYGEAGVDEVRALNEEGIEVLPLPVLPEDRN
jgi:hypothetical protein